MIASASTDGKNLDFTFVNATNLAKPTAMHMHRLQVGFNDADHFNQEWTLRTDGKDQPVVFRFQHAK